MPNLCYPLLQELPAEQTVSHCIVYDSSGLAHSQASPHTQEMNHLIIVNKS